MPERLVNYFDATLFPRIDVESRASDHADHGQCCMTRLLSNQADFKKQKRFLEEIFERRGHVAIFLPKFHCELNIIGYFWGVRNDAPGRTVIIHSMG